MAIPNPIRKTYDSYVANGGTLTYSQWQKAGMPKATGLNLPQGTTPTGGNKGFGQPGKDPIWTWNWSPPSLKTTIPTVTGSTTPQWGNLPGQGLPSSGFQWTSPNGQVLPTGGLNLQNVGATNTPPAQPPTAVTTPTETAGGLPGEVGLPPEAWGGNRVLIGNKWFYFGKNGIYYDVVDGQWLPVDPASINSLNSTTQSKLDPGFRSWLVRQYGEDKAAWFDNAVGDDPKLVELRDYYNTKVNPIIPVQDTGAMTDYQRQMAELERQKFEYEKQLAEQERWRQEKEAENKAWTVQYNLQKEASQSAIEKQRNEMELIKGRAFPFGDESGRRQQAARDTSGAFEAARQSILASLTQPSDWIKRWEVQNAPNPYKPQSWLEEKTQLLDDTGTRIGMFGQMADEAQKLVDQLSTNPDYGAGTPNEAFILTQARNDVVKYRNAAQSEQEKIGAYQADVTYLQGQPQEVQVAQKGNAPAPSWLPMFAPGQRVGQAITKESIPTPSAQQWSAAPWSAQQGLSGYTDWAGGRSMADILGNMAQMLPNNPGGGARWSPYLGR